MSAIKIFGPGNAHGNRMQISQTNQNEEKASRWRACILQD